MRRSLDTYSDLRLASRFRDLNSIIKRLNLAHRAFFSGHLFHVAVGSSLILRKRLIVSMRLRHSQNDRLAHKLRLLRNKLPSASEKRCGQTNGLQYRAPFHEGHESGISFDSRQIHLSAPHPKYARVRKSLQIVVRNLTRRRQCLF